MSSQLRYLSIIGKNLLNSNTFSTRPDNMVNFGSLAAEIGLLVRGHPSWLQRVSLLGSVTARHSSSGRQQNCGDEERAPPIFGRAAVTLGIGPPSSITLFCYLASSELLTRSLPRLPSYFPDCLVLDLFSMKLSRVQHWWIHYSYSKPS